MPSDWLRRWRRALRVKLLLSDDDQFLVKRIVQSVIPGAEFNVFGSRATGRARPFSDLDLLILRPERLSWEQRAALCDAFEASDLPFCVDVVEAGSLSKGMASRVIQEMQPI